MVSYFLYFEAIERNRASHCTVTRFSIHCSLVMFDVSAYFTIWILSTIIKLSIYDRCDRCVFFLSKVKRPGSLLFLSYLILKYNNTTWKTKWLQYKLHKLHQIISICEPPHILACPLYVTYWRESAPYHIPLFGSYLQHSHRYNLWLFVSYALVFLANLRQHSPIMGRSEQQTTYLFQQYCSLVITTMWKKKKKKKTQNKI